MFLRLPALVVTVAIVIALVPSTCGATTTVTAEELASRRARVASWSPLEGEWEGEVSQAWVAQSTLMIHLRIVGKRCFVRVRRNVGEPWEELAAQEIPPLAKESVVFAFESANPRFLGRHGGLLERKDEDISQLVLGRIVAKPEHGGARSFEELRSGTLKRVPRSQRIEQ